MVDPQAAGMAHVGADEIDEAGIGVLAQRMGIEGGQTPVLAGRVEDVRRRPDMHARHNDVRARPSLCAGAVCADGEIAVETDRHSLGSCDLRGRRPVAGRRSIASRRGTRSGPDVPLRSGQPIGEPASWYSFGPPPPIRLLGRLCREMLAQAPGSGRTARACRPARGESPRKPCRVPDRRPLRNTSKSAFSTGSFKRATAA